MQDRSVKALKFNNFTLKEILDKIHTGEISLPFFQRDFEWNTKNMKSLLASLFLGLPVGSILVLKDTKNQFVRRRIEGVIEKNNLATEFLLDGQQRLTSLYSIFNIIDKDISKKRSIHQRWFLNLELFDQKESDPFSYEFENLEPETIEDYLLTKSKRITENHDNIFFENELDEYFIIACQDEFIIPLDLFYINTDEDENTENEKRDKLLDAIISKRRAHWKAKLPDIPDKKLIDLSYKWKSSVESYLISILEYTTIPVLQFEHDKFNRAIQAFEILNKAGVKLHIFDLLVARAARFTKKESLHDAQSNVSEFYETVQHLYDQDLPASEISKIQSKYNLQSWNLSSFEDDSSFPTNKMKDFLVNALTLLISEHIEKKPNEYKSGDHSIKRTISNNFLFSLDSIEYSSKLLNEYIGPAMIRLQRALCFLQVRCGIRQLNDIHYKLIILPIIAVMNDKVWKNQESLNLIEAWYWQTIFSGNYEYNQSQVTIVEIIRLEKILRKKEELETNHILKRESEERIDPYWFDKVGFDTMKTCMPSNGFYKTIMQFIISTNPHDFLTDNRLNSWNPEANKYQDHHIITLNSMKTIKETTQILRKDKKNPLNSILNRTMISKSSNQSIGGMLFTQYKEAIIDTTLYDHFIEDSELPLIKDNDLSKDIIENFLKRRYHELRKAIIKRILQLCNY